MFAAVQFGLCVFIKGQSVDAVDFDSSQTCCSCSEGFHKTAASVLLKLRDRVGGISHHSAEPMKNLVRSVF